MEARSEVRKSTTDTMWASTCTLASNLLQLPIILLSKSVESVGDGGRGRLVYDTKNFETSDDTRVLGGLPLRVVAEGTATILSSSEIDREVSDRAASHGNVPLLNLSTMHIC